MRILLVAKRDWCNIGFMMAQALEKNGIDATMITKREDSIEYPEHGIVIRRRSRINPYAKKADVILFMHSQYRYFNVDLSRKKVLVWHTGSGYRKRYKRLNPFFNPLVDASICAKELMGLGAKNEKWVGGLVDTETINPVYARKNSKIIIAHYPAHDRGLNNIQHAIDQLEDLKDRFVFLHEEEIVPWVEQLNRVAECDIYIDGFQKRLNKMPIGDFGIGTLEAAALGKIVVARYMFIEEYEKQNGACAVHAVRTLDELVNKLRELIMLSDEELLRLKKQSRDWVVRCHSYEAAAQRLLKIIEEIK